MVFRVYSSDGIVFSESSFEDGTSRKQEWSRIDVQSQDGDHIQENRREGGRQVKVESHCAQAKRLLIEKRISLIANEWIWEQLAILEFQIGGEE